MSELRIKAATENMNEVLGFVDKILEENKCSMKAQMQIDERSKRQICCSGKGGVYGRKYCC